MKNNIKIIGFITCFLLTALVTAQTRIYASDIVRDIKNGKDITYKNVIIVGNLDFTFMEEQVTKLPKRKRSWWSNSSSGNKVEKHISNKITFENCTFEGNVFAYIHDEDTGYTFIANFNEIAIFKNCVFKEMALFKYSNFNRKADFSSSIFSGSTNFKYANFKNDINFSNATFEEESTFKYTKFLNNVSFSNALFKETAVFKYTQFKDGVSFKKTRFEENLNIKYTKVQGSFEITGMQVAQTIDSKYTRINGKKFNYQQMQY